MRLARKNRPTATSDCETRTSTKSGARAPDAEVHFQHPHQSPSRRDPKVKAPSLDEPIVQPTIGEVHSKLSSIDFAETGNDATETESHSPEVSAFADKLGDVCGLS